jgi:hypothetical protein
MIIKNHDIELKDTSASEMARFRQIMLSIWRQQIEDDKNSAEMHRYVNTIELKDSGATVSPLTSILLWIKKNIGNKTKELKLSSLPKNTFLDSLSDTYKGHFIKCNRFLFETIVDLKNIKFEASFRPVQTVFQLSIFNPQKSLVFRFETSTYEGLEYLAKFIGYDIDIFKRTITQQYKKEIAAAGNDKNKLDIIYEVIPDFILRTLKTDQQMYADIWRLLDQDISDTLGRDEDKAILNILKTLQKKDAKKLYEKLYERPLWVMKLYKTFSGDDRKNFVALIMDLCRYSKNGPAKNQKIYLPDGYWLSNVQLNVNWSNNMIVIENSSTLLTNFGNLMVSSSPTTGSKNPVGLKTLYKGGLLNPMDLITVKSVIGMDKDRKITTEAASNQVALFIKYTVDELSDEIFWNVINVASTLAGGYGAVRILAIEGTGWLIKTAAILELSKVTLDLVMLNDNAKKALREAGLGILVDNWTTISITADLTFLSLDGLLALAKYGNKGAKVLKAANQLDEAAHLESQTEKAFIEIEKQTDIDVSKMTETEIDVVAKKIKNKTKTVKELEEGIAKIKHKSTQKKLTKLLKEGDEVSQNAVQEYLAAYNINNRVIKNTGALEKAVNKKVVQAYKERFAKFDLRDAKGIKIDVTNLTEMNIDNLFKNKYFIEYNGKLIPLKFEAHHIIPKDLLLDEDMIELRNFVSRNKENFDFNGIDNGIPVHKLDAKYPELGGHSSHPEYNNLSREKIVEIKAKSTIKGTFYQDIFDKKLLDHINDTREKIINEVIAESKKINHLKL